MSNPVNIFLDSVLQSNPMAKLFFLGMAKNAGKTTALNFVYEAAVQLTRQPIVLMTSGYDGEAEDAVTGLPKPRIKLFSHTYAVTAAAALKILPKETFTVIEVFPWSTPFGQPILIQANEAIEIPLIAPGPVDRLSAVMNSLTRLGKQYLTLIDGSINRKAFLKLSTNKDHIILAAGATFSREIHIQLEAITFLSELLNLPVTNEADITEVNVLDAESAATLAGMDIVVYDATSIFLTAGEFKRLFTRRVNVFTKKELAKIGMIAINPFHPEGNWNMEELTLALKRKFADIPVMDIHAESHA